MDKNDTKIIRHVASKLGISPTGTQISNIKNLCCGDITCIERELRKLMTQESNDIFSSEEMSEDGSCVSSPLSPKI